MVVVYVKDVILDFFLSLSIVLYATSVFLTRETEFSQTFQKVLSCEPCIVPQTVGPLSSIPCLKMKMS